MTSLDSIKGWSIKTLLRGENVSKQSVEIQANDYHVRNCLGKNEIKHSAYEYKEVNFTSYNNNLYITTPDYIPVSKNLGWSLASII